MSLYYMQVRILSLVIGKNNTLNQCIKLTTTTRKILLTKRRPSMNSNKHLHLLLVLMCHTSLALATVQSKALYVTQKSIGVFTLLASLSAAHSYSNKVTGIKHLNLLILPSAATGLNLLLGRKLLPKGKLGTTLTVAGGLFTVNAVATSLRIKPANTYTLSEGNSQFDLFLLCATLAQTFDCSSEVYKRVNAWRAKKHSAQTSPSTSAL